MASHLHYEESLRRDLDRIRAKVGDMGALAAEALRGCLRALAERNRQIAYSVILRDQRIDDLEKQIDRLCLEFLVRQQPVGAHLRLAYVTMKINLELERVGDYAESIARHVLALSDLGFPGPLERVGQIGALAIPMIEQAIAAYQREDAQIARSTIEAEDTVDKLRFQLNSDLVRLEQERKIPIEALTAFMTIVNRFERVADQAKSICQQVQYLCTGEYSVHKDADVYRVLFVDEHGSCRSPLAEAIGRSLKQSRFIFTSAGLDPRELVDSAAAFFASGKGIDMSRQKPLGVHQVPHLDHYQIIIALAEEARKVFPAPPTKTVCLDWSLKDPSRVSGSPEAINAAYEEAYGFLKAHIHDLVEAVLGDHIR
jgi:phosphate transport system protein